MRVRINIPNDRAVSGRFVSLEWKRRLFTAAPKHQFADAGPDRVQSHHRCTFVFEICIERLDDKYFSTVERFVLNGRNDSTDDASDLHYVLAGSLNSISGTLSTLDKIYRVDHADDR